MARKIEVQITGNSASFERALARSGAAASSFGGKMGGVLSKATKLGGIALAGLGAGAVKAAIDFESSFAGVKKTVDATPKQFEAISKSLRAMSKEIPTNVNELNRIAESAGALGIKGKNIISFTRTIADMGETTNLVGEEAAATMARLANITKMPQEEFGRLGSTIVDLGNKGASTEAEIANMGLRIAAAGTQVGITLPEILGMANALSSLGIEAESGGTAMSKTMATIDSAVTGGGKSLALFADTAGMSATTFAAKWKADPTEALITFVEGLGKVKGAGGDVYKVLKELGLNGERVKAALIGASGAGDLLRDSVKNGNAAWRDGKALQEEAAKRYETVASQLKVLKNRFTDMGISIGTAVLPKIVQMIPAIESFGQKMASLGPTVVSAANVAKGALSGMGGAVSSSLGQFVTVSAGSAVAFSAAMGKIATAWKGLQAMFVGNPFGLAAVAIGLLVGYLFSAKTATTQTTQALKDAVAALREVKDATIKAASAEITLAESKNRLKAAALNVTAAIKTKQQAQETSGKSSLAYKQAENSVEAAYIARRRAALEVKAATEAAAGATGKATAVNKQASGGLDELKTRFAQITQNAKNYQTEGNRAGLVTGRIQTLAGQALVKRFAGEMGQLAKEARVTAASLKTADPALARHYEGLAKAAEGAADFAKKTGTIPKAIEKIKGPSVAAMDAVGRAVAAQASAAGSSVGVSFGQGVVAGIGSQLQFAGAAAEALIYKAHARARAAAQSQSPSRLMMKLGADMAIGVALGIAKDAPKAAEAMRRLAMAAAAGFNTNTLLAQLDAAAAKWTRYGAAVTPTEAILAKAAAAEEVRSLKRGIADAREELASARKIKKAGERAKAIIEAEQGLATAEAALTTYRLTKVAEAERAGRDKQVAIAVAGIEKLKAEVARRTETLGAAFDKVGEKLERAFGAKTQAMVASLGKTFDAQIDKVRKWQQELTAGEQALKDFDTGVGKQGMTASEQELATLDEGEAERDRQRGLAAAKKALADAENMAVTSSDEARARNEAILAAEEGMRSAMLTITRAGLTAKAAAERAARETDNAERRTSLEAKATEERAYRDKEAGEQIAALEASKTRAIANLEETRAGELVVLQAGLAQLKTELAKRPGQWSATQKKVVALLKTYGVDMTNSGEELGEAFAKGLTKAEGEVKAAAQRLAAIPQAYLKLKSPAEKGPLSTLDTWWSGLGSTLAGGIDTGAVEAAANRLAGATSVGFGGSGGGFSGGSIAGAGGGSGGYGTTTTVQIMGPVYSDERGLEELTRKITESVERRMRRNR